jgi:hypothetical protein
MWPPREIDALQAFLVWHRQKLMARRHRDRKCVTCGQRHEPHTRPTTLRCKPCQADRRERLKTMVVSCVGMEA